MKFNFSSGERRPACSRRQLADDNFLAGALKRLFGRLPKRTGWQPVLPDNRSSANLHRDRQEMINHVRAAVGIAFYRLRSALRIGRAHNELLLSRLGRRLPIEFP